VYRHISTTEIGDIYATADLVVARAGANTVSELAALKKPSVLIPLPWAARQEQEKHARYMEQHGLATVFEQHESSTHLLHCIRDILARHVPKHAFDSVAYLGSVTCAAVMFETIFKDISKQARQSL
jgi:UDP-N-acetylglucosamine--N-acetylmuramyl-(pentapeptide) pyrophosphoryl-undecaprenol N-acetylglucosamine transferase